MTNSEHIIPLSLGGVNGFEIPVDAGFNSKIGNEVDGALANDFMWALIRTERDARGHSGKMPKATIKDATYGDDDRLAQAHFHKKYGVALWDVRDREYHGGANTINISTSIDIDLPMRFTSKVALAAGYYVYGDVFRQHTDHQQLRDAMNTDLSKLDATKSLDEHGLGHLTLTVDRYFDTPPADYNIQRIRLFCAAVSGSVVMLVPARDLFTVAVGILGQYLAMVTVPANTEAFPRKGEYTGGHIVALSDKKLYRTSLADGLSQFVKVHYPSEISLPLTPLRQLSQELVTSLTGIEQFGSQASTHGV